MKEKAKINLKTMTTLPTKRNMKKQMTSLMKTRPATTALMKEVTSLRSTKTSMTKKLQP